MPEVFYFESEDRNRNLLRLTRSPQETAEQCYEPDSASLSLAEQVDSGEYKRKKSHEEVALLSLAPATGIEPVTTP